MNDDQPLVSIIALGFNHEAYLCETLTSILNQTYSNIQLIIIDDCSQDNSVKMIQSWIADNALDCIFIPHQRNQGICRSLNEGLSLCKGKYYQVIACDDVMLPEKIKNQVAILEQCGEQVAAVYSDAFLIDDDSRLKEGLFIAMQRTLEVPPSGNLFNILLEKNFIPAMSVLIRTDVVREVGGYDESLLFEDFDLWLRISQKYDFVHSDQISVKYRLHGSNLHKTMRSWDMQLYWVYRKFLDNKIAEERFHKAFLQIYRMNDFSLPQVQDYSSFYVKNIILKLCLKFRIRYKYYRKLSGYFGR